MLSHVQQQAVEYIDGASLIIAGAGSGKTRVLTHKIAHLIDNGYEPWSILALTFTNKAAAEMKERMAKLLGDQRQARRVTMGTFHSIFSRILRAEATALGFTRDFTIYDAQDSKNLVKQIIKEMCLDDKLYKASTVAGRISSAKNNLITPTIYANNSGLQKEDALGKRPLTVDIYKRYWARCRQANAMDFDDLLLNTNILFRDFPDILAHYQQAFRFILVDEYQDTNYAQHLIIKQLAKNHGLVCAVGDDAQSIYSFRGAVIDNIIHFKNDFPKCELFKLEQNYRSTQTIVKAANSLISKNKNQIKKEVFSENEVGEKIEIIQTQSDMEEAAAVVNKIQQAAFTPNVKYDHFAILYRTNSQSRVLEDALLSRSIPYRIYGGLSFYQRKEIKDIVAYLRICINPHDEEAYKRIINTPARGIGNTTIGKIADAAQLHGKSLWDVSSSPLTYNLSINSGTARKLELFHTFMRTMLELLTQLPLDEFVSTMVKESGYMAELSQDRSVETLSRIENIEEFVRAIHDYAQKQLEEQGKEAELSEFLSEISLLSDQDVKAEQEEGPTECVTLMTIHSAKGLEFKHVFIVGLEENLFPSGMTIEDPKGLEEERRLMYVAITRAEKSCTLSCAKSRFRHGNMDFPRPSRFLAEIDPSLIRGNLQTIRPTQGTSSMRSNASPFGSGKAPSATAQRNATPSNYADTINQRASAFRQTLPATTERSAHTSETFDNIAFTLHQSVPVHARIIHERFGKGVVTSAEPDRITVLFNEVGAKTLILKFARIAIDE